MKTLFHDLIGKHVTLLTDNDALSASDQPFRDDGILEAFDGLIVRLQKLGHDRLYFPIHSIQKATTDPHSEVVLAPEAAVQPGELLKDLLDQSVSVWLCSARSRTDGVLEAFDSETIRINTGGQLAYFPMESVRVLKIRDTV